MFCLVIKKEKKLHIKMTSFSIQNNRFYNLSFLKLYIGRIFVIPNVTKLTYLLLEAP